MNDHTFLSRYRQEITLALVTALSAFALFGLRLWVTYPFNCGPEECRISFTTLNQLRAEILFTFGPFIAFTFALGMVFIIRDTQGKTTPFSGVGLFALACLAVLNVGLIINPIFGVFLAPAGIGIAILTIPTILILKFTRKLKSFRWGDLIVVFITVAWGGLCYLLAIRFWEAFGD